MNRRCVYVVSSDAGHVKIGMAKNPHRRVSALKTGSATRLELGYAVHCALEAAPQIEARAHDILADARSHGEWFAVDLMTATKAIIRAAEELGYDIKRWHHHRPPLGKRGRPPTDSARLILRLRPDMLDALDTWMERQAEPMSRQDAIRRAIISLLTGAEH